MELLNITGLEIYSDIKLSLKDASDLLCEILSGIVHGPTCSFIKPGWDEIDSVDIDENDDYHSQKAKKHPDDRFAFIYFRYIIGVEPVHNISEFEFKKAVYKINDILTAKGYPSVVNDNTPAEDLL